ncbi:DUF4407 domain-containing protein [Prevotella sp.]|uniref:DUF4407 domain-containing protein n=1 Tax=Prevotella sp. TaxID=59823 RepID=UPI002A801062|nr:DUF4407 domain-containing protein [Prevotella sp.]MDY4645423.1 DUF4407 domain-containing protein [Prevotella sp.]
MNWWSKFGCKLTGWSSEVLAQCSEASRCQLSKYTSALMILILIWSVTGFCFAQRYIGLPVWGCCLVSLFFITIVIMIERQIILTTEKSLSMLAFRAVIALVMAIVGSTIFDQTMFGKDIDKQMANTIEVQVAELTTQRVHTIDEKLAALKTESDSITAINSLLQEDVNKNPFIIQTSRTSASNKVLMPDGSFKTVSNPSVTKSEVPNPKLTQIETNNKKLAQISEQEQKWTEKKQTMEEDVRKECKESVGFLEELEAMWSIITNRPLAGAFYLVFFFLLMSLELFVVVSKTVDKECDYEAAIKGAQKIRISQFNKAFNHVRI